MLIFGIHPAWLTAIGGFLIHMVFGSLYVWGNITPVVTSHLRKFEPNLTYNDTVFVYIASLAANGFFMLFSSYVQIRIGTRMCVFLGGYAVALAALLASFSDSLWSMILAEGFMFGFGFGIAYTAPITCAVEWLPERKGLLTGIIIAGIGVGSSFFSMVANTYTNPEEISVDDSGSGTDYYPSDSAIPNRVPMMYRLLAGLYFTFVTIGGLLIQPHYDKNAEGPSLDHVVANRPSSLDPYSCVGDSNSGIAYHTTVRDGKDEPFIGKFASSREPSRTTGRYRSASNPMCDPESIATSAAAHCHKEAAIAIREDTTVGTDYSMDQAEVGVVLPKPAGVRARSFRRVNTGYRSHANGSNYTVDTNDSGSDEEADSPLHENIDMLSVTKGHPEHVITAGGAGAVGVLTEHSADSLFRHRLQSDLFIGPQLPREPICLELQPFELIYYELAWRFCFCFVATTIGGMYMSATFKTFGEDHFKDELFISSVGYASAVFNTLGRVSWGYFGDKFGSLRVLTTVNIVFAIIIITYPMCLSLGQTGYAFWTCCIFFCEGGNFALYPPITMQLFGYAHGGGNYGAFFSIFTIFVVIAISIISLADVDMTVASILLGSVCLAGGMVLFSFPRETLRS